MAPGTTSFTSQQAPCGKMVDGECHEDHDDDGLIVNDVFYRCGCRTVRHEYHDGSMTRRVVHHNGHILVDELIS